jgi:hypothetical protein
MFPPPDAFQVKLEQSDGNIKALWLAKQKRKMPPKSRFGVVKQSI